MEDGVEIAEGVEDGEVTAIEAYTLGGTEEEEMQAALRSVVEAERDGVDVEVQETVFVATTEVRGKLDLV